MALPGISNKKRLIFLLAIVAALFLFMIGKLAYIIFFEGAKLQSKAQDQWTRDLVVSPTRGSILDRNGNVLAQSATADTVVLRPAQIKDANEVADELSKILEMDRETVFERATAKKSEVWLKRQISKEQKNAILDMQDKGKLKGVVFTVDSKRYYPNKDLLTQVLGFTSVDGNGLDGLEAQYNKYLKGQPGRIVSEADRKGQEIPLSDEFYIPPKDGYNVVLTIDLVIQSFLERELKEALQVNNAKSAQGIAVDPKTGEILAMANLPSYDLNKVPRDDLSALQELSRNKVVVDVYEPGSTFKVITTASAIDSGAATLETHYNCPGFHFVDGEKIKCWRSYRPHGDQDLTTAVKNSCNPAFMSMALAMGKEKFYEYIYNFGFGQNTGIDYSADQKGIVSPIKYVRNTDLARIGFGQSIAVTPLQLVMGASAVVNGGTLLKPYLVKAFLDTENNTVKDFSPTQVRRVISEETSKTMCSILEQVVSDGSGRNAYIPGYHVGGKTGTAQKYVDGVIAQGKHISSFLGFAPANDPKILVLIVVDEPKVAVDFGSVVAAPFVKSVLEDSLKYMNVAPQYSERDKAPVTVQVPDLRNKTLEEAKAALNASHLDYQEDGTGRVNNQVPAPGETVEQGTMVLLYMSEARQDEDIVVVPDLKNMNVKDATDALKNAGLEIQIGGIGGLAAYQKPAAGEKIQKGTKVRVEFKNP